MKPRDPVEWIDSLSGVRPFSPAWRATIRGVYGRVPLTEKERALFLRLSGGREPPEGGCDEALWVVGRRGGKDDSISRVVSFEAMYGGHEIAAAPGQRLLIPVICPLITQSREMVRYVSGLARLAAVARHVEKITADGVEFKNGVCIQVMTASEVAVVGSTLVAAVRNEWARWPGDDSTTPDTAIEGSLRPALAPVAGAPTRRIVGITSAFVTDGLAYDTDEKNYGKPDAPVFVFRGSSKAFNPNLSDEWLAKERARLPHDFAREYLGEWQAAVTEGWFGRDNLAACIERERTTAPPPDPRRRYWAAIDASGLRPGGDRFTLAIATSQRGKRDDATGKVAPRRTDVVWCWSLQPRRGETEGAYVVEACIKRAAAILRQYGCASVAIDQFAAQYIEERLAAHDIRAVYTPWKGGTGEEAKCTKYRAIRSSMMDRTLTLPNEQELLREFGNIRGELLRSGAERIEAARGHDDRVSAAVLAAHVAMSHAADILDMSAHERRERAENDRRLAAATGGAGDCIGLGPMQYAHETDDEFEARLSDEEDRELFAELKEQEEERNGRKTVW